MKGNIIHIISKPYLIQYYTCMSNDMEEIQFPDWQRCLQIEHVEDILNYQESYIKENGCFDFKDFIKLGLNGQKYYCLDGQHRLETIKILSERYKPFQVLIQVTHYPSHTEMIQDFKILHKSTPVSEYVLEH